MSLKHFLTGDKHEQYNSLDELKLDKQTDIYKVVLYNTDRFQTRVYSPTDIELKNIVHTIGEFEPFPLNLSETNTKKIFFDRVAVLHSILQNERIGYFGSSPYGMFSLVTTLTDLPFRESEKVYEYLDEQEFEVNKNRSQLHKITKQTHVINYQGKSIGNCGLGNTLTLMLMELPNGFEFAEKVEIGSNVVAGEVLMVKKQ